MPNLWLVQTSNLNNQDISKTYNALNELGYSVLDFGVIPFEDTITNLDNIYESSGCNYTMRCGTKVLKILSNLKDTSTINSGVTLGGSDFVDALINSVDYNENLFDQKYYSNKDIPLLNSGGEYHLIKDVLDHSFTNDKFIKPSKDLKSFAGGILNKGQKVFEFIESVGYQRSFIDEYVLISPVVDTGSEYRFFIIEDRVVACSRYFRNGKIDVSSVVPLDYINIANEMALLYKPSNLFVMDLAFTSLGVYIVEYNCWNVSGFYDSDTIKLFSEVNNYKTG